MKQLLPFFLFIFLSCQMMGQTFSIEPSNPIIFNATVNFSDNQYAEELTGAFTNLTDETLDIKWEVFEMNCDTEWDYQVCDANNCYFWGVLSNEGMPVNNPVTLAPNESSILQLKIKPKGLGSCCEPMIVLSDFNDPNIIFDTVHYEACIDDLSSITEREKANLRAYPNPTPNYISVSNNNFVKNIWVSNILGKRVRTFQVNPSNNYDLSTVPDGIYLVSMVDENSTVLKTVRISKRAIRP